MADRDSDDPWAGWIRWVEPMPGTFAEVIGPSYARAEGENRATVMVECKPSFANQLGTLHGGFLAAFADHCCFAAVHALDRPEQREGITIDLTMQFMGAGVVGPPLRADVELLQETRRLIFMRMTIHQEDRLIAASTATFRKVRESR